MNGASPGPAPAAQARASNSLAHPASWRTWPHRKLRRKVPRVDGALTVPGRGRSRRCATRRRGVDAVAASQRRRHQGHHLVARVRPARGRGQGRDGCGPVGAGPGNRARVAGRISPALATRRWSSKANGCGRGGGVVASIRCSLFWGRFSVSKPLSPEAREHLLTGDADPTPSFGGFGIKLLCHIFSDIRLSGVVACGGAAPAPPL